MAVGLDRFGEHFADYTDRYVLIGGSAAWLVLDEAGLDPRATKDLDIVLCIEALDPAFGRTFWDFVRAGQYELQQKSDGAKAFYRFSKPAVSGFPAMLEIFSRPPQGLELGDDSHLTPIPISDDVSSLSAILLEDGYYEFLHAHKREIDGVSIVTEVCLIPLKARAWLDLTRRKAEGAQVDSKDIKKHRSDVVRLYQLLSPDDRISLPGQVKIDLHAFLDELASQLTPAMLKQLGIRGVAPEEVLETLQRVYE